MSLRSIARNYARALSETLAADDAVRRMEEELGALARAVGEVPELGEFLAAPHVPADAKLQVAERVLAGCGASKETRALVRLLIGRRRFGLLREVAEEFSGIARERLGLVDAEVISAVPLGDAVRSRATKALERLTRRRVRATFRVDPAVLGGIRARVRDTIFDGSVQGRLERLRAHVAGA
jgi:F-type H+-transporting ATPase subunit delta